MTADAVLAEGAKAVEVTATDGAGNANAVAGTLGLGNDALRVYDSSSTTLLPLDRWRRPSTGPTRRR